MRLGAESSLLYTDIIVQLGDGSLSNIEIQKISYAFPGEQGDEYVLKRIVGIGSQYRIVHD